MRNAGSKSAAISHPLECCVGLLLKVGRFKVLQHGIMFGVESF